MTRIDFSTLFGISAAITMILVSISLGGDVNKYFNLPSFLIVVGCTLAVSCACYSLSEVYLALKTICVIIFISPSDSRDIAIKSIATAEYAYKHTLLNLEKNIDIPVTNKIFRKWLGYIADTQKPESIDLLISQEISTIQEQQNIVVQLLKKAAEVAPACGLIGTLVGLIQMLSSINDIVSIGSGMSVALLTTFYGAILSYIIILPLATKIEKNTKQEILNYTIFYKAIMSIAYRENPRQLEPILNSILPQGKKIVYFKY